MYVLAKVLCGIYIVGVVAWVTIALRAIHYDKKTRELWEQKMNKKVSDEINQRNSRQKR